MVLLAPVLVRVEILGDQGELEGLQLVLFAATDGAEVGCQAREDIVNVLRPVVVDRQAFFVLDPQGIRAGHAAASGPSHLEIAQVTVDTVSVGFVWPTGAAVGASGAEIAVDESDPQIWVLTV